jgi:hypothetical protein
VSDFDSSYIYKHFLFYHPETNAFDDIDEPFIEEYWETQNEKARKYYFLSAFLKSIPVVHRVIMLSYLDNEKKIEAHNWIYNNLQNSNDTIRYFKVLDSGYGVSYSKLKIPKCVVKKYCIECSYK